MFCIVFIYSKQVTSQRDLLPSNITIVISRITIVISRTQSQTDIVIGRIIWFEINI